MSATPPTYSPQLRPVVAVADSRDATAPSPSTLAFPGRVSISPEEFAEATGLGRTLVYLALSRNEIPHRRVGRRILIPLSSLDTWLAQLGN